MKTLLMTIVLSFFLLSVDSDVSMLGIKINDSKKTLDNLQLRIVSSDIKIKSSMIKYRTENGNDLSVSTKDGKIVYLENDWLGNKKGNQPLFTNFIFGETSLNNILNTFHTKGFTYKSRIAFSLENDMITFSCFEIDSPNNEILVLITSTPLNKNLTEENIYEKLKLVAVILANEVYLDKIWGKEKIYDINYKKIRL